VNAGSIIEASAGSPIRKPEARHRDAELRCGDVAFRVGHRAPDGARAPMSLRDQLINPRLSNRDDREFRGDEESIREHQDHQRGETPQDSRNGQLHGSLRTVQLHIAKTRNANISSGS
jgi:hypothetical protein